MNEHLFEVRCVPRKDVSLNVGITFAHLIVQGGPAMPCLSSCTM